MNTLDDSLNGKGRLGGRGEEGEDVHSKLIKSLLVCDIQLLPRAANYVNYFLIYDVK
jgi:hypothetical protein